MKQLKLAIFAIILSLSLVDVANATTANASKQTIMEALLGAGTGAISAEVSGGKAGTGALVGAGTAVIGRVLFDLLATPRQSSYATSQYRYVEPPQAPTTYVSQPVQPTYYSSQPSTNYGSAPATSDDSREVIKNGLMGAATGAIASEVSGGKAGTGALVGAGTQVIGTALVDLIFTPSQQSPQPIYSGYIPPQPRRSSNASSGDYSRKIVRTFDEDGNVVSEEEYFL